MVEGGTSKIKFEFASSIFYQFYSVLMLSLRVLALPSLRLVCGIDLGAFARFVYVELGLW